MPIFPQARNIPCAKTQPQIGMGFDSNTGAFLGTALEFDPSLGASFSQGNDSK